MEKILSIAEEKHYWPILVKILMKVNVIKVAMSV